MRYIPTSALVRRLLRQAVVWAATADTVAAKIYGPHLEDLAREWCLSHASAATLGGSAHDVLPATVVCREHRVVTSTRQPLGTAAVQRLDHLRDLVAPVATDRPRLLLFSRVGFTADARHLAADRDDIELIDLDRLYRGA